MSSAESETSASGNRDQGAGAAVGLVAQVRNQTGRLADQGLAKAAELAEGRKQDAAQKLETVVEVVRTFAGDVDTRFGSVAGGAVNRGGDAVETVARKLRDSSVEDMVDGTRSILSRHPGLAIGAASVLGFLAGRVAKGGLARRQVPRNNNEPVRTTEAAA